MRRITGFCDHVPINNTVACGIQTDLVCALCDADVCDAHAYRLGYTGRPALAGPPHDRAARAPAFCVKCEPLLNSVAARNLYYDAMDALVISLRALKVEDNMRKEALKL